jgi:hypothetical protein
VQFKEFKVAHRDIKEGVFFPVPPPTDSEFRFAFR